MMNDDELRSRMSGLADQAQLDTVTLEQVHARSRRRTLQQRGVTVLAAFALVVGGAVGIAALNGADGDDDVNVAAEDADAEAVTDSEGVDDAETTESTDAETDARVEADDAVSTTTVGPESVTTTDEAAESSFVEGGDFYGGGVNRVLAWGDGFLAFGDRFIPAEPVPFDFSEDSPIAGYFPDSILDVLQAADVTSVDEATMVLEEAGLLGEATQIVTENPEVFEWYNANINGGTYETYVEYSDDGLSWAPVDDFAWPGDLGWVPQMSSNGTHLVAVVNETVWDESGRASDPQITVYVTDDLQTWSAVAVPVTVPDVPDYVQLDVSANQIVVSDDEWYLTVSSWQWLDLWSALPQDVINEMGENGYDWQPTEAGVEIVQWNWEEYEEYAVTTTTVLSGDAAEGDLAIEEPWVEPEPTLIRVIPWSEFPFTYDEYMNAQMDNGSGQGFVGDFAGGVSTVSVPGDQPHGQVIAVGDGLFTIVHDYPEFDETADHSALTEADYAPTITAYASADGSTWTAVPLPDLGDTGWIDSAVAVEDGILLTASGASPGQRFFLGAADGSGFVEVDGPDVGDQYLWFSGYNTTGDGAATIIDLGQQTYPEFIAYKVVFEHDGFEISTAQDGQGLVTLAVVDIATGETVYDFSGEVYGEPPFVYLDNTIVVTDDDGETVVEIPFEVAEREIFQAESAAWDAAMAADPYEPDFRLVATRDGRNWVVQSLPAPDAEYGWYGEAVVSGDVVLISDGMGGWTRVDLP
ncbi:MAG: hypothetical protein AAGE98_04890 [Actinomycetota bacterium]